MGDKYFKGYNTETESEEEEGPEVPDEVPVVIYE
jgi:hypothetical protein